MTDVTITVRGESEKRVPPERAMIHVTVRTQGVQRAAVVERVMNLAGPLRTSITERADAGSIIEWSSKRVAVHAERPWNDQGRQLAPVHYASVDFSATFDEAFELSNWVSEILPWDGVEIGGVDWHLTTQTRAAVERDVASAAVSVAVQRARAYAAALGLETVVPVEIADTGLITHDQSPGPQMMKARSAAFIGSADALGPTMEYEPEDIVITAAVEARFAAR